MLVFDEATHTYKWKGVIAPSVTTILKEWIKVEYRGMAFYVNTFDQTAIASGVFESAGYFGTAIHHANDLILNGTLEWGSVEDRYLPCLAQFEKWLIDFDVQPIESEKRLYSEQHGYAGTLDFRGSILGSLNALVDYKTSNIYHTVGAQTAAYDNAYCEETGAEPADRYVLELPRNGSPYKFKKIGRPSDYRVFLNELSTLRYRQHA